MSYRVIGIPHTVAEAVRATQQSPFGRHPTHVEVATGPLPGPVFIHEEPCNAYPEHAGFPEDLTPHPLTLNAYGHERTLLAQVRAEPGQADAGIAALLARPDVVYVHVRDTKAGCYDFRVER